MWEEQPLLSRSRAAVVGDITVLSPVQASTLLLRNTLIALKGEP